MSVVRDQLTGMARHAADWLHRRALVARTVTIKVRYSDFTTITRSHTATPTRERAAIVARVLRLADRTEAGIRPVRLLGVSVHNLQRDAGAGPSPGLPFSDDARETSSDVPV
jgi:DNA polymerase-4